LRRVTTFAALAQVIEIELCAAMGGTHLLPPPKPVDFVLM
jgi:hypothetical protein